VRSNACHAPLVLPSLYTLCHHKLNFLNALTLTLSRREREF
jgi:hypothetical protein